jgi:hypothetical protein
MLYLFILFYFHKDHIFMIFYLCCQITIHTSFSISQMIFLGWFVSSHAKIGPLPPFISFVSYLLLMNVVLYPNYLSLNAYYLLLPLTNWTSYSSKESFFLNFHSHTPVYYSSLSNLYNCLLFIVFVSSLELRFSSSSSRMVCHFGEDGCRKSGQRRATRVAFGGGLFVAGFGIFLLFISVYDCIFPIFYSFSVLYLSFY